MASGEIFIGVIALFSLVSSVFSGITFYQIKRTDKLKDNAESMQNKRMDDMEKAHNKRMDELCQKIDEVTCWMNYMKGYSNGKK